ncbi:fructokinase [Salmonella enterica subsp. arizonae]|uniref:Fructokinase n=1 Tax=Salmonella enterica subsp. arizonae TaxID=59203 RepID=A0A2X4U2C7_SALER|nr:fructokinase [Salmonella enterica subsp. arizonae]
MRIGIDLGGTKTEVIALDDAGEQRFRHRLPTPRDDYQQTIETIAALVDMAEQATSQTAASALAFLVLSRLTPAS